MNTSFTVSDKKVDLKGYMFVARNKTIKFPHVFNDCWDFRFRSCAVTPKNMLLLMFSVSFSFHCEVPEKIEHTRSGQ